LKPQAVRRVLLPKLGVKHRSKAARKSLRFGAGNHQEVLEWVVHPWRGKLFPPSQSAGKAPLFASVIAFEVTNIILEVHRTILVARCSSALDCHLVFVVLGGF
jgi:hypothetical protein